MSQILTRAATARRDFLTAFTVGADSNVTMPSYSRLRLAPRTYMRNRRRTMTMTRRRRRFGNPSANRRTGGFIGRFQRGNRVEYKWYDQALSDWTVGNDIAPVSNTPATAPLLCPGRGTAPTERIGQKVLAKSITIRGYVTLKPEATVPPAAPSNGVGALVYIWIVLDRQPNGTQALGLDVFDGTHAPTAMHSMEYAARFTVIKKICVSLESGTVNELGQYSMAQIPFEWHGRVNIPQWYDSQAISGNNVVGIRTNNIFMLAGRGEQSAGLCEITFRSRVRYTDL